MIVTLHPIVHIDSLIACIFAYMYILCMPPLCFCIIVIPLTDHFHVRRPYWVGCNTTPTTLPIRLSPVGNDLSLEEESVWHKYRDIKNIKLTSQHFKLYPIGLTLLFHIGVVVSNPRVPHLISPALHLNGGIIKANVLEAFYCSLVRETIDSLGVGEQFFHVLESYLWDLTCIEPHVS
mgnify:CR=1 FL=1